MIASPVRPGLALFALALGGFAIGTTEFAAMSLLPDMARGLGVDEPTAGHVVSAYALGVVVGAPLIAIGAARFPRRRVLIALMIAFALFNALSAFAPDYRSMLALRFLSGLPHGAFFGVGALVAASLVPRERRTQAVSRMMLGLTVATVIGVPVATTLGHQVGWRWGFGIVALLALATAAMVALAAPRDAGDPAASPLRELSALTRPQVWLTLLTGAIGFGGLFAVYAYLASTLAAVTHAGPAMVPVAFAIFGVGMTVGNLACAWAADRALMPTAGATLALSALFLTLYAPAASDIATLLPVLFLIGLGGGLGTVLQSRLMDVAEGGQTLAAALHHAAFNIANAIGPWAGGLAIAAGHGWTSTGPVGSALALGGLAVWALSLLLDRRRSSASLVGVSRRS